MWWRQAPLLFAGLSTLAACSNSERPAVHADDATPTGRQGTAGGAGGSSDTAGGDSTLNTASGGSDAGAGAEPAPASAVPSCVRAVTSVGPSSLTTLSVAGSVLDASEHDCAFTVGTPLVLPLEADDPSTL